MRAGPEHIPVGEKPPIQRRPDLLEVALLDQAGGVQPAIEVLRQRMVLRRRGSPEMVERQAEPAIDVGLGSMLLAAEAAHILSGLYGPEFGRGSVFIGGADKQHVVTELPEETRMHVGGKQGAGEIAEMLDAVHIRQRAGNENPGHGSIFRDKRMPNPKKSKSPP